MARRTASTPSARVDRPEARLYSAETMIARDVVKARQPAFV